MPRRWRIHERRGRTRELAPGGPGPRAAPAGLRRARRAGGHAIGSAEKLRLGPCLVVQPVESGASLVPLNPRTYPGFSILLLVSLPLAWLAADVEIPRTLLARATVSGVPFLDRRCLPWIWLVLSVEEHHTDGLVPSNSKAEKRQNR